MFKTGMIIVLSLTIIALGFFLFKQNSDDDGVSITGSGTQNIDASQQGGGVKNLYTSGNETINIESEGGTHGCKNNVYKNYGTFKHGKNKGPLCKKPISTKIKKEKCKEKGITIHQNLCVMEWETNGGYFRVRLLKN